MTETPTRMARCTYYGSTPNGENHSSNYQCRRGAKCLCTVPADKELPFYEEQAGHEFARFYCGCWGWE